MTQYIFDIFFIALGAFEKSFNIFLSNMTYNNFININEKNMNISIVILIRIITK